MFNLFKKKEKESFLPSEFIKNYIIAHQSFSESDIIKIHFMKSLKKKMQLRIDYDVLHDVLMILDETYLKEIVKIRKLAIKIPLPDYHTKTKINHLEKTDVDLSNNAKNNWWLK